MHAKTNSTWGWIEAHVGALTALILVTAVIGGVLLNLRSNVARPSVMATAPDLAASTALTEHDRNLARLLELNTVYMPTHSPTAEDLALNNRSLARLLELNTVYVPTHGAIAEDRVLSNERYLARLRDLNMLAAPASERASAADVAAHERSLARLRELNTSGDSVVDADWLPMHLPRQYAGPY